MVVYVASHAARWYRTEDLLGPYLCSGHCRMTCRWGSINIIITRGISFTRWIHSRNIQPNLFWFFTRFQLCLIISYTFSTQQSCGGVYCFQSSAFAVQVGLLGSCTFYHLCWIWVKSKSFPLCCWLAICPQYVSYPTTQQSIGAPLNLTKIDLSGWIKWFCFMELTDPIYIHELSPSEIS